MSTDELTAENARLRRVAVILADQTLSLGSILTDGRGDRFTAGEVADGMLASLARVPLAGPPVDKAADLVDAFLARLSADPTPITPPAKG